MIRYEGRGSRLSLQSPLKEAECRMKGWAPAAAGAGTPNSWTQNFLFHCPLQPGLGAGSALDRLEAEESRSVLLLGPSYYSLSDVSVIGPSSGVCWCLDEHCACVLG